MTARRPFTGMLILLLGAWGAIVPYLGPAIGYRMTTVGSWTWTAGAWELHLAPGAIAIVGGLLLISRRWASTALGAWLGLVGGAWLIVGPLFAALWLPLGAAETQVATANLNQAMRPLGYHYGTGLLLVVVAAYVLGRAWARRVVAAQPTPAWQQAVATDSSPPSAPVGPASDEPEPVGGRHRA